MFETQPSLALATYRVVYYAPDGHGIVDPLPIEGKYELFDDALQAVMDAGALPDPWEDEDGNLCYHESDALGCGGFKITMVAKNKRGTP